MKPCSGEEKTVLVCDLRNFTSYTENNDIEDVVDRIEDIITYVFNILSQRDGTYINFTGDGLIFSYDKEIDAIDSALSVRKFITEYNKKAHKKKTNNTNGDGNK